MNPKDELIIDQYREKKEIFNRLGETAERILKQIADEAHINPMALQHRVKTEESLAGKLRLKGYKYKSLSDITDILGARFICYFSDDVYKIASGVEKHFVIDRENSVDKSKMLSEDSFGYLSLHYICSLPENAGAPELCGMRFEIQIRTGLQHIWAAINHNTTYKSDYDVPREIRRSLSRLAGLMELADEEFIRVRNRMNAYTEEIRRKIIENRADDVQLSLISLNEYMQSNREMQRFLGELAAIEGSEICAVSPEPYLEQFKWLGMTSLGDVQDMLRRNEKAALSMANLALSGTGLDILTSNVGLYYLCRAELAARNCTAREAAEFFAISGDRDWAERQARKLFENYRKSKRRRRKRNGHKPA